MKLICFLSAAALAGGVSLWNWETQQEGPAAPAATSPEPGRGILSSSNQEEVQRAIEYRAAAEAERAAAEGMAVNRYVERMYAQGGMAGPDASDDNGPGNGRAHYLYLQAMKEYQESEGEAKNAARTKVQEALAKQYDLLLEEQGRQIGELEARLTKLKDQLKRRQEAKSRMVELKLEMVLSQADGLGWPSGGEGGGFGSSWQGFYPGDGSSYFFMNDGGGGPGAGLPSLPNLIPPGGSFPQPPTPPNADSRPRDSINSIDPNNPNNLNNPAATSPLSGGGGYRGGR